MKKFNREQFIQDTIAKRKAKARAFLKEDYESGVHKANADIKEESSLRLQILGSGVLDILDAMDMKQNLPIDDKRVREVNARIVKTGLCLNGSKHGLGNFQRIGKTGAWNMSESTSTFWRDGSWVKEKGDFTESFLAPQLLPLTYEALLGEH